MLGTCVKCFNMLYFCLCYFNIIGLSLSRSFWFTCSKKSICFPWNRKKSLPSIICRAHHITTLQIRDTRLSHHAKLKEWSVPVPRLKTVVKTALFTWQKLDDRSTVASFFMVIWSVAIIKDYSMCISKCNIKARTYKA